MVVLLKKAGCYKIKSIYRKHYENGTIAQINLRLEGLKEPCIFYDNISIEYFESMQLKRGDLVTVYNRQSKYWAIVKGNTVP